MMLPWIGYALLTAAALALFGAVLEHSLGGGRIARRFIWLGIMVATVAIPIVGSMVVSPRVTTVSPNLTAPVAGAPVPASISLDRIVGFSWIGLTTVAVLLLVASHVALRRRLDTCGRTRIDDDTVFVSEDFGPAVVGVFRPEIVVPRWALALGDPDRRLVVAHEREHIRAHDPAVNALGLTLAVLFPWNATLWWQLKRLRLAIEIDCDARVVRHGHDPVRYGELLVSAHTSVTRRVAPVLALAQHRSALSRRIDALVSSPRRSIARGLVAGVFAGALFVAIAAAPPPTLRRRIQVVAAETPVASATDTVVAPPVIVPGVRPMTRRAAIAVALPPASITPNTLDAELATLPPPKAAPMAAIRLRVGGAGGFGGFIVPTGQSAVMAGPLNTRPDTSVARGSVMQVIRRDSTPP
jgi:beta-lactamase regulating signal transducer with metallopeptidase domain